MNSLTFDSPVWVSLDWETPVQIRTLGDMHRFLTDWPPSRRTTGFATAQRACDAAREGLLTAEQARRAFESFAKVHGILWSEPDACWADLALRRSSDHHA
jgi:hypothetical protein